jgi:sugar/nucleoside kinase (ribokinase family)
MASGPAIFVGNATQDSVFFVAHLPRQDEVCAVRKNIKCLGGRGVVPALVAGALGLESELCTVVGHDLRDEFSEFLNSNHVDTSGVKWDVSNCGVTQYVAFIGEETGTSVAVANAPSLDWRSTASQRDLVRRARIAYFSTNNLDFNLELLDCVADDVPVIHNLGIRLADNPAYLDAMLGKSTLLIGNRIELSNIASATGLTPQDMLSSSTSLENIIITAGREGAQLFSRGEDAPVNYPGRTVDRMRSPVGAGDSFAVGLLWSIISGKSRGEGIRLGMALGALAVASERSYPDLKEVGEITR